MAKMLTCPCGCAIISPPGDEDVKKHIIIHVKDTQPGTAKKNEELGRMIKTV